MALIDSSGLAVIGEKSCEWEYEDPFSPATSFQWVDEIVDLKEPWEK